MSQATKKIFFSVLLTVIIGGLAVVIGSLYLISRELPNIIQIADYKPLGVTRIIAKDGKEDVVVAEFSKERRYLIPYEKIPDLVVKAFVSAEDENFFQHKGISPISILRATYANLMAGHVVQGGSTITQQVAKSLFLSPERNILRKVREVILSQRLESNLTKQQILYIYLNQIYLGNGAYGIQAAARSYYHKDASEMTIGEIAVLAGMPRAPSKFSPFSNPKRAKERQLYVLKRMMETKAITPKEMADAGAQTIRVFRSDEHGIPEMAYLTEHIRRHLVQKYGEKAVLEDGLNVIVPSTPSLYKTAVAGLKEGVRALDKRRGYRGPISNLKTEEEIKAFTEKVSHDLLRQKFPFQLLTTDGRIVFPDMNQDDVFLRSALYKAVVTKFEVGKTTMVTAVVGNIEFKINEDGFAWAKDYLKEKKLQKGDVILVKFLKRERNQVFGQLEQEPQVQAALLSLDAQTGDVLAMVGGYDADKSEFNRAIQAKRQPGSAFKPIIYSAAIESGFTPASVIVDSPIVFDDKENGKWKPSNYEEKFYGDTTFRQALIDSRNIPTIKLVQAVGVNKIIEYARRLGFTGEFNQDLSISLGSSTISLLELTQVYSLFPRLGKKINPVFISKVIDKDGKVLEEREPQSMDILAQAQEAMSKWGQASSDRATPVPGTGATPITSASPSATASATTKLIDQKPDPNSDHVLDPRVASVMTHLMKEVVEYGTGRKAKSLGRPVAGKTGTTNENKDAWFMGFTPRIVTGVWVGFDELQSLGNGETGANAALPIWISYMQEAVKNDPGNDFLVPPGVVYAKIDAKTGKLASSRSSGAIVESFLEGTQPTERSQFSAPKQNDSSSGEFLKEE